MEIIDVVKIEIAKLELKPGDVLVIRIPRGHYSPGLIEELMQSFPDNKCVVIDEDTEFSILREER